MIILSKNSFFSPSDAVILLCTCQVEGSHNGCYLYLNIIIIIYFRKDEKMNCILYIMPKVLYLLVDVDVCLEVRKWVINFQPVSDRKPKAIIDFFRGIVFEVILQGPRYVDCALATYMNLKFTLWIAFCEINLDSFWNFMGHKSYFITE